MGWEPVLVVLLVMMVPISVAGFTTLAVVLRPISEQLAELVQLQTTHARSAGQEGAHRRTAPPDEIPPRRTPALTSVTGRPGFEE